MDEVTVPPEQQLAANAQTNLDWMCKLSVLSKSAKFTHTSIIATLGFASKSVEMIEKLIDAGVHILRIPLTYHKFEQHEETIQNIKTAVDNYNKKFKRSVVIGIALELRGPEIRTGRIEGEEDEIELKKGATLKVTNDRSFADKCTSNMIYIGYERLTKNIRKGDKIYIKGGFIVLVVTEIFANVLICKVEAGWTLANKDIVNMPGIKIEKPAINEYDKLCINFAIEQDADIIILPYARSADNILEVRKALAEKSKNLFVLAKIQDMCAMDNIDEIIKESDGVIVGRGDLVVELPLEKLFIAQKSIINKCNQLGKPCIIGYQIMMSMQNKPRPNRAEVADMSCAVMDGCDGVLLASETSRGNYPDECIAITVNVCKEAEAARWFKRAFQETTDMTHLPFLSVEAVCLSAVRAAEKVKAAFIITTTNTGHTAQNLARYQSRCPIIVVAKDIKVLKKMLLYRSLIPLLYKKRKCDDWFQDLDARIQLAIQYGVEHDFVKPKDPIVIVSGWKAGTGFTNTIRIVYLSSFPTTYTY